MNPEKKAYYEGSNARHEDDEGATKPPSMPDAHINHRYEDDEGTSKPQVSHVSRSFESPKWIDPEKKRHYALQQRKAHRNKFEDDDEIIKPAPPRSVSSASTAHAAMKVHPPAPQIGAFAVSMETQEVVHRSRQYYEGDDQSTIPSLQQSEDWEQQREQHPVSRNQNSIPEEYEDVPIAAEIAPNDTLQAQVDALQAQMTSMLSPEKRAVTAEDDSGVSPELNASQEARKRRRLVVILLVLLAVLAGVVAAIVVVTGSGSSSDDDPPEESLPPLINSIETMSPTLRGSPSWKRIGQEMKGVNAQNFVGHTVSMSRDGTTLAVGAPGELGGVAVFRLDESSQVWKPLGQEIRDTNQYRFGWVVSSNGDGNIVAVGAPPHYGQMGNMTGFVKVYEFDESSSQWNQLGETIFGGVVGDNFGESLALSDAGDIIAIGSTEEGFQGAGSVRLYRRYFSDVWEPMGQVLKGVGASSNDMFGYSVALSAPGTIVTVGAYDYGGENQGQVSVFQFQYDTQSWVPLGEPLYGDQDAVEERFGFSVSLDKSGSTMAVGSRWGKALRQGSVTAFLYDASTKSWTQQGQVIHGKAEYDLFGWSVSISPDGDMLAAGARFNDDNGNNTGQVRVFEYNPSNSAWFQKGSDLNGVDPHEEYGKSVSFAGTSSSPFVACGGPRYNNEKGHVEVFSFW